MERSAIRDQRTHLLIPDFANASSGLRLRAFGPDHAVTGHREEAMKRTNLNRAVLSAAIVVVGVGMTWLLGAEATAQTPQPQARTVPVFEVDPAWPKVPAHWKLGDAS